MRLLSVQLIDCRLATFDRSPVNCMSESVAIVSLLWDLLSDRNELQVQEDSESSVEYSALPEKH